MKLDTEQLVTIKCLHHNVPIEKQIHIRLLSLLFRNSEWDIDGIPVDQNLSQTHEAIPGEPLPTTDPAVTLANPVENTKMPFKGNRRVDWADTISSVAHYNCGDPPLLVQPAKEPAAPHPIPRPKCLGQANSIEGSEPGHCLPRSGYHQDHRAWADRRRNQQGAGYLPWCQRQQLSTKENNYRIFLICCAPFPLILNIATFSVVLQVLIN